MMLLHASVAARPEISKKGKVGDIGSFADSRIVPEHMATYMSPGATGQDRRTPAEKIF